MQANYIRNGMDANYYNAAVRSKGTEWHTTT